MSGIVISNNPASRSGRFELPDRDRGAILERYRPAYRLALGLLLLLTILSMLRRNDHDGMLLGLAVMFFTLILSRYHFSLAALLFTWTAIDRRDIANTVSSVWLFAVMLPFGLLFWSPRMTRCICATTCSTSAYSYPIRSERF